MSAKPATETETEGRYWQWTLDTVNLHR